VIDDIMYYSSAGNEKEVADYRLKYTTMVHNKSKLLITSKVCVTSTL